MEGPQRNLQKIDMVCDWIPGLSTITNGAELLYKLATEKKVYKVADKVDTLASSIQPKKKATDLNIHLANKSKIDCFIGMIPILGNIKNFVHFCRHGLPSSIEQAIEKNNREAIALYFEKYPLDQVDDKKAQTLLQKAATFCNSTLFNEILNKKSWKLSDITVVLRESVKQKANSIKIDLLLHYCIINEFKELDFENFKWIILKNLPLPDRDPPSGLTQEHMKRMVSLTTSCKLRDLSAYCRNFSEEASSLQKTDTLYQLHFSLVEELLDKTSSEEKKEDPGWQSDLRGIFQTLIKKGEQKIFFMVHDKYGENLSDDEKKQLLTSIYLLDTDDSKNLIKAYLLRSINDFSHEDAFDILNQLADNKKSASIAKDVIEARPEIKNWDNEKVNDILEKCKTALQ